MPALQDFRLSTEVKRKKPWASLAVVVGRGLSNNNLSRILLIRREVFEEKIKLERQKILGNIGVFDSYFKSQGFACPLLHQFRSAEKGGLPASFPLVQALLTCETASGVLMGVHDLDRIEGDVVVDLAREEETFQGMRFPVFCRPGEIVLRDGMGTVASFFQGPDCRTLVGALTQNAVFFIFNAPGLDETVFRGAISMVAELIQPAAEEIEWKVFN